MKSVVAVLTAWGPWGLFALATLDSAGIPLPAAVDALLVATAVVNRDAALFAALMAVIGSVTGSMVLFWLARKGGEAYLERASLSRGAQQLREWFQTYGLITVFIPAILPIPLPLKMFILCAGALGVRPLTFLLVVLAARIPRYFGLAWLGSHFGVDTLPWILSHVWHLLGVALALGLAMYLVVRAMHDRRMIKSSSG